MAYLDKTGLTYFYGKIKGIFALKSDIPTALSQLGEDASHRVVTDTEKAAWNDKSNFSGNYNDLSNKPTIPTIPSSLPANGGNADTVDGWHFEVIGDGSSPSTVNTISFDYTEG